MALTPGSCTIDSKTGAIAGSGLALDLANAWKAASDAYNAANPPSDKAPNAMAIGSSFVQAFCNQMALAILNHITANAVVTVTVTTGTAGLQRTPNPNNPSTATLAPASNQNISGTVG